LQRARQSGLVEVRVHNIRDFTHARHHTTDDTPYGGGGGMVMKPEPVFEAVESVLGFTSALSQPPPIPVILLTPQGRVFTQRVAVTSVLLCSAVAMKVWTNAFVNTWSTMKFLLAIMC
jgi:tRNA (guanine37-N1)-methyltransferase